jgi:hypothetical protein
MSLKISTRPMRRLGSYERSESEVTVTKETPEKDEASFGTDVGIGGKADSRVPPHIQRSALYFHALTEIWEYYRALGNTVPIEFMTEMRRAEKVMIEDLQSEMNQGGVLHEYYQQIRKEDEERRKLNEARTRK